MSISIFSPQLIIFNWINKLIRIKINPKDMEGWRHDKIKHFMYCFEFGWVYLLMPTALIHVMQKTENKNKLHSKIYSSNELIGTELENKVTGKRMEAENLADWMKLILIKYNMLQHFAFCLCVQLRWILWKYTYIRSQYFILIIF